MISKNFLGKVLMFSALAVSPILMSSSKVEASQRSVGNRYGVQNQVSFSDKASALADLTQRGLKLLDRRPHRYQPGVYKYKLKYQVVDDRYNVIRDFTTPRTDRTNSVADYKYWICAVIEDEDGDIHDAIPFCGGYGDSAEFICRRTIVKPGDKEYSDIDSKYKIVCAIDEMIKDFGDESGDCFKAPYEMLPMDGGALRYRDDLVDNHLKNIFGLEIRGEDYTDTSDDEIISPEVDDFDFLA